MKHSDINWSSFISLGKRLVGKPYVFGAEVDLKNPDPDAVKALDCAELVEFLYAHAKTNMGQPTALRIPDGSYNQAKACQKIEGGFEEFPKRLLIGDLGFKWNPDTEVIHHVGVFLGNQDVLEAKGKQWGVILTTVDKYMASSHFAYWARLRSIQDA